MKYKLFRNIFIILFILSICTLHPFATNAQVPVPRLPLQKLNPQDFQAIFQDARGAQTAQAWDGLVLAMRGQIQAAWEIQADQAIAQELTKVTAADTYNTTLNYRTYLQNQLEIQKRNALTDWTELAENSIQAERVSFLTALYTKSTTAAEKNTKSEVNSASTTANTTQNVNAAVQNLQMQRAEYKRQMQVYESQVLSQYQQAANQLQSNRDDYLQAIATADSKFQANLQQIDAYEQTVRNGISTQLNSLDTYLQNSDMFYAVNCDGQNVCTVDRNKLSAAGSTLKVLITDMRNKLQARAPISVMARQMTDYLAARETQARNNNQYWNGERVKAGALPTASSVAAAGFNAYIPLKWDGNVHGDILREIERKIGAESKYEYVRAVIEFQTGNTAALAAYLKKNQGEYRRAINISGFDVRGDSHASVYDVGPTQDRLWGAGKYFSEEKYDFATFFARGWVGPPPVPVQGIFSETSYLVENGSYAWYDDNAAANANTWNTHATELNPLVLKWRNEIMPAINAWEEQSDLYKANYANWQVQAQQQLSAYEQNYTKNIDQVVYDANRFQARIIQEKKQGDNKLSMIQTIVGAKQSSELMKEQALSLTPVAPSAPPSGLNRAVLAARVSAPDLNSDFFSASNQELPDVKNLQKVSDAIQDGLMGNLNFAVAQNQNDDAIKTQADANENLVKMMKEGQEVSDASVQKAWEQQLKDWRKNAAERYWEYHEPLDEAKTKAEIRASMKEQIERQKWDDIQIRDGQIVATRQAATGTSTFNGGDATQAASYSVDKDTQTFSFTGAGTVKLADAGGLYSGDYDLNKAVSNFRDNTNEFYTTLNAKGEGLAQGITDANTILEKNLSDANRDIANQQSQARQIQSFIQAMIPGGGGLKGWVEGQVEGAISTFIEDTFHIPAALGRGLMNGLEPGEALNNAIEQTAYQYIDAASGLSGLGGYIRESLANEGQKRRRREMINNLNPISAYTTGFQLLADSQLGRSIDAFPSVVAGGVSDLLSLPPLPFNSISEMNAITRDTIRLAGHSLMNAYGVKKGIEKRDIEFRERTLEETRDFYDQLSVYDPGKPGKVQPMKVVGDLVSGVLSPSTQGLLAKPNVPKSQSKYQLEDSLTKVISSTFGIPASFAKATVFENASIEQAMTQQFIENIDKEYHIPGLGERVIEEYNKHERNRKAHAAARVAAEDIALSAATGGLHGVLTYAWRNQEYDKDIAVALQIAETAGAIAVNIVPGAGQAASAAMLTYMAAKGAYQSTLHGGGVMGAALAAGSAYVSAYTGPVGIGASYSKDEGFGVSLSGNLPLSGSGLTLGGSVSFTEHSGYTGSSVNLGMEGVTDGGTEFYGAIGFNQDGRGEYSGANVSGGVKGNPNYRGQDLHTRYGGVLNFGPDGHFTSASVEVDLARESNGQSGLPFLPGDTKLTSHIGGGLGFGKDGTVDINTRYGISMTSTGKAGFNGLSPEASNTLTFNSKGSLESTSNSIDTTFEYQTAAQARANRDGRIRELQGKREAEEISEDEKKELQNLQDISINPVAEDESVLTNALAWLKEAPGRLYDTIGDTAERIGNFFSRVHNGDRYNWETQDEQKAREAVDEQQYKTDMLRVELENQRGGFFTDGTITAAQLAEDLKKKIAANGGAYFDEDLKLEIYQMADGSYDVSEVMDTQLAGDSPGHSFYDRLCASRPPSLFDQPMEYLRINNPSLYVLLKGPYGSDAGDKERALAELSEMAKEELAGGRCGTGPDTLNCMDITALGLGGGPLKGASPAKIRAFLKLVKDVGWKNALEKTKLILNKVVSIGAAKDFLKTHSIGGTYSSNRVRTLAESMKKSGWIGEPIDVIILSGKKYVLNGHHRVRAAARAKIGVKYRVLEESKALSKYKYKNADEIIWNAIEAGADKTKP